MVNLFKRKTKRTDAVPEPAAAADEPQSADVAEAMPLAATSLQEPATRQPADTTFTPFASTDDESMRVEEKWQDGALVLRAALPGIDPNRDVRLTVVDGHLVIEADRHQEDKIERDGYVLKGERHSMFTRALPLSDDLDTLAITGSYKDGVLALRIPMPTNPTQPVVTILSTT